MIEIDGSFGEGGGQILRTSLTLSSLTKKPFRIYNIRANRPKPGLQRQHLTAVNAVKILTNATVKGDYVGSTELIFSPGDIQEKGDFVFDIGTAGSTTLILQTILPLLLNRKLTVTIKGGTDVPKSPSIDYIRLVFSKVLERIGISFNVELIKRGHYPEGGGEIRISNVRGEPQRFSITEFGQLEGFVGISHVSSLPVHIADRQKSSAEKILRRLKDKIDIRLDVREGEISKGSGICLSAIGKYGIIGADALGERGKRAETVGEEAALKLLEELKTNAAFDSHMGDMLMLYASLYQGEYTASKLTLHSITNEKVIRKFIDIKGEIKGSSPFLFRVQ
ncbi:RNA 3'-terminal phosphate cyclase [Sulfolobus acidocaldarius]|uniref:RNA 3'-terminal phosphate cyclase n=4 Tax=Sulfolobus acidocaldarius TaxID=2285 RepID=RTCA_SULAC|nr:RNA 3'-terminal phosphate cyclase [Sulfolobus acidocaldarius]Q4JB78.1 RecName: Full=RNA 3'-terminal phosphate cyclase; Short=RNA cyclase; Short=RNA-3'-phosphate cyclase [Sulfolobus acidocaldarius DSM 639]AAY79951.1 RNA 3'-terminal phosphate cyclase [Sulfolobus acidocaldarius DSM 639]AGE70521.1 RNA 3'-terminal-phosphate cyclase [Sulfolobus acidocaldarius N8]AGE72794.1 RNA 3'-terminal-phosphate cyclase [Sulfolobus acidocaldarius Ron12/I]ALU29115.1 RNA 3'-phosphate cyclase [Sulfolobus acidocal